jgi:hypothetical protein
MKVGPFFLSVLLIMLSTVFFLINLKVHATGRGQYIVSRHIIFFSSLGIIAIVYLTGNLWQSLKNPPWFKFLTMAMIGAILFFRINKGF